MQRNSKHRPETREKMRESGLSAWNDPVKRRNIIEGQKKVKERQAQNGQQLKENVHSE